MKSSNFGLQDPALIAQAHIFYHNIVKNGPPSPEASLKLFERLKALMVRQGEIDFEQEVRYHPYGMQLPQDVLKEGHFRQWLEANYNHNDYIVMPLNSMGKYKNKWDWIYFKEKRHAMLFKLTWL